LNLIFKLVFIPFFFFWNNLSFSELMKKEKKPMFSSLLTQKKNSLPDIQRNRLFFMLKTFSHFFIIYVEQPYI